MLLVFEELPIVRFYESSDTSLVVPFVQDVNLLVFLELVSWNEHFPISAKAIWERHFFLALPSFLLCLLLLRIIGIGIICSWGIVSFRALCYVVCSCSYDGFLMKEVS